MESIKNIGDSYQTQFANDVMSLSAAAITLYVLWKGYQTLAGKSQTPLADLAWDLAKFGIIIAFVTNAGGYLTSTTDALQGMKDGFSGGVSVWKTLDNLWLSTQNLADKVYQKDTDFVPMAGAVGMILVWAGSIILMAIGTVVYLVADVTMNLLTITAPIFIFCLMFGFLRSMFNNWLQMMFSSILTVLFASLVIRIGMDFQGDILKQVINASAISNIITSGAMGFMAGMLSALLVLIARSFATQLAGAGVDGAVQGMAMMGLGIAGVAAGRLGASAGRSGVGLGYGLAGKQRDSDKSLAGQAGNWVGQSVRTGADKSYDVLASSGVLGAQAKRLATIEQAKARNAA
ncbi:type IV secretion system protein [Xenorhabdus entomophaga]|uniref:type IV secretion system protein n=1 Tax=Xenorhabdus entomophaga TaxID=3136257 RepID=UPI0030F44C4D